jgi:hypothetical protein
MVNDEQLIDQNDTVIEIFIMNQFIAGTINNAKLSIHHTLKAHRIGSTICVS